MKPRSPGARPARAGRRARRKETRLWRSARRSESVQFCVGVGEIAHIPDDTLSLLGDHRETGGRRVETTGAEANKLQAHRSEQLTAVVQFCLCFLLLAADIGECPALTAKQR